MAKHTGHPSRWGTPRNTGLALWLLVAAAAVAGLGRYRVSNDLSAWSSDALRADEWSSTVVVAWEPTLSPEDEQSLREQLQGIDRVTVCIASELLLAQAEVNHVNAGDALHGVLLRHEATSDRAALIRTIRQACRSHGLADADVYLSGPTAVGVALDDWSQRGLQRASLLILLVGFFGVWLATRRWSVAALTCLAIYASQLILMGVWAWSGRAVDMMLSAVPPLMMALGFSFALHRASRPHIFLPMLLCGATTAAGFLTLAMTRAPAIRGFALWGALGIALVWASVMLLVPSAVLAPYHAASLNTRSTTRRPPIVSQQALLILAVMVTLLAIPSAWSIRICDNPLSELPVDATIRRDTHQIDQRLMGTLPSRLKLSPGQAITAETLTRLPQVRQVLRDPHADRTGNTYVLLSANDEPARLAQAIRDDQRNNAQWTGPAAQVVALADSVKATAALSLPVMALLIFIVLFVISRDWAACLIGVWVCLLPVLAIVAVIGMLKLPVGLTALMTGAITLGVAVDDTIHLLADTKRHGIDEAWRCCRTPCLHSSLIAAGCMLCLMTTPFKPTATFGMLLAVSILVAVIADLFVLPAALACLPRVRRSRIPAHRLIPGATPT